MTDILTPQNTAFLDTDTPRPARPPQPKPPRQDNSLGHFWLVQKEGRFWDRGRVLRFDPHLSQGTLGRSLSCTWRLNDPQVSRLHGALIRKPKRGVYLVDLGSRKGTYVNGREVETEILLMDGDRIRLGNSILEFTQRKPHGVRPDGRRFLVRSAAALGVVVVAVAARLLIG